MKNIQTMNQKKLAELEEKDTQNMNQAVQKQKQEDEARFNGLLQKMTEELNQNKKAMTEMSVKFQKLSDENKTLKLRLDVREEMKQLSQQESDSDKKSTGAQILDSISTGNES